MRCWISPLCARRWPRSTTRAVAGRASIRNWRFACCFWVLCTTWPEIQIQFLPKYASWLNLIEPWWKQLKSLALKGRRFETTEELQGAFEGAHHYWMRHRRPYHWREIPEVLVPKAVLGGYGSVLIPRVA
jgi:transposase